MFLGLLSAFSLLTFDLYQPSLSYITGYFDTTYSLSQLTLSIYLLFFGLTQLIWGPLIDHFGRKRLLPASLILAIIASLICIAAPNIYVLIFARALQGIALCCASLVADSSSRDREDPVERAKVLSYISMIISVSPILAPVLGSVMFTYFGWKSNFILMVGIGMGLLIQSRFSLQESPSWIKPRQSFSLKNMMDAYKIILHSSVLWSGAMIMMFSFAAVMLTVVNSAYLIIDILGFSPFGFGILFAFNGLNIILGNYLGIWFRERFEMTLTLYLGNGFIILGGLLMFLTYMVFGFNLLSLSCALVSNLGISISAPATMSFALEDFQEHSGTAAAFINTLRMLGSSVLSMILGYLLLFNLNALPTGLILCGLGALFFSWQFNTSRRKSDDSEFDGDRGALPLG